MKTPDQLSDKQLADYADKHVKYELDMLIWTASMLRPLSPYRDELWIPWATGNALMDSFAIHARVLVDFLYIRDDEKRRVRATDVVIQDYIDETALASALPRITPTLSEVNTKADKQVAHLTIDRVRYESEGKEWKVSQITADIMRAFKSLAPHFPDSKTNVIFRTLLENIVDHLYEVGAEITRSAASMPAGLRMEWPLMGELD